VKWRASIRSLYLFLALQPSFSRWYMISAGLSGVQFSAWLDKAFGSTRLRPTDSGERLSPDSPTLGAGSTDSVNTGT
jgi:hypothetical protein